jgi:hypothetical protein
MANFVLIAGARLGAWAWDDVVPRLREAGHGAYDDTVAALLAGGNWRLVELDTGHWPMFSRPRELAEILLDAAAE